ncbi:MAG: glycosyltransferase family 4 protein [Gemmataceae bacterium]
MTRLKIAHVSTVSQGLKILLLNQMRSFQDQGFEVVGISAPGPEVAAIESAGVRYVPVPMTRRITPLADLISLWRLYRVMRRERFALVHTHTPKAALLGQYAAALAGVPIRVHTIHGLYFPGNMKPRRRWLYTLMERLTMLPSHLNLSQNPEDIPVAIQERICRADRIQLLGNGIDLEAFDPARQPPEKRLATRARLGLTREHKVVGMVARFVAEKGWHEMLEAAQIIKQQCPAARFLFIGPMEPFKKDALQPALIEEMGLADAAQLLGYRADMPDLYAIMDVLALPSHREGFPRAPMEAAALGVPSVVTEIRGCRQAVTHNATGYLVPVRAPKQLASALLDLLRDDCRRQAFGRAARKTALEEFDERAVFARVHRAYQQLLAKGGKGEDGNGRCEPTTRHTLPNLENSTD